MENTKVVFKDDPIDGGVQLFSPLCPYVLAQFKRYPEEYADVWLKKST